LCNNNDNEKEDMTASRRKAQKRKEKKNQKEKRRLADLGMNTRISTSTTSNQQGSFEQPSVSQNSNNTRTLNSINSDPSGRKNCNTCGGFFDSACEFRAHFRSDWHRFNQKLKMNGSTPISEKEFLLCDSETFFNSDIL